MDLHLEKSLQGSGLGKGDMEDKLLSMQQVPPLHVTDVLPLHVTILLSLNIKRREMSTERQEGLSG